MVDVTYQMVLNTIQTIALVVGIVYYLTIMKNQQKTRELALESQRQATETRQAQLFMGLYQSLFSRNFVEAEFSYWHIKMKTAQDFNNLMKNKEEYIAWNTYAAYYEGIGVLVREGLVDIRIVFLLLSGLIIQFWEQFRDFALDYRRSMNFDRFLVEVEYLYNRVIEYRRQEPELSISSPDWVGDKIKPEKQ